MAQRWSRWGVILLIIFIVASLVAGYFALQLRRSAPPPPANFLAADKDYGVTVDLTLYDNPTLADTLASLHQNGLTWLRQPVTWAEIEPAPGQFDWEALDRIVGQAFSLSPDIKLIAVLYTTPTWARPANTPPTTPPTEVSDFGNFARALAGRYGDQIDAYQIWHEPNLSANWGNAFVDPGAYADLLREAAVNIHTADPQAVILTAALAPTLENGPLNLNDLAYLDQLYQAQGNRWFDVVAGQAYGFDAEPTDPARPDALNFNRLELLRQVMLNHGDADTPIWATAFGWNALPDNWTGQPSPWTNDTPEVQAQRTETAIAWARQNWPWLGPMLAIRWDSAGLAADDPARGFALRETPPILAIIQTAATRPLLATAGRYPPDHPTGHYGPGWRFTLSAADIPRHEPRTLTIPFEGTRLDLTVNRGPFRGYLWVTIDGQATNSLPQDDQGRSYVVLYDPLQESEAVTLARHLAPGPHEAVIEAEGGWGQWAIGGWTVYNERDTRTFQIGLGAASVITVLSGLVCLGWLIQNPAAAAKLAWAWGEILVALYAILGERGQILITFALAIAFYLTPGWGALALLPFVALTILLRPDLGLALVAFSLSFFQAYKQLPLGSVSPVELALALAMIGFIFRGLLAWGRVRYAPEETQSAQTSTFTLYVLRFTFHTTDWAALTLVALGLASTLTAENFGVSMREWRVLVLESVIFYFLVRLGLDFNPTANHQPPTADQSQAIYPPSSIFYPPTWAWRLVDAFIAGAVLQALIALYLYFFTDQSITTEGVRRALGLAYGSPNNLSLFLDRAWPILLAVTVWPGGSGAASATTNPTPGNSGELRGTQGNSNLPSIPTGSSEFPSALRRWLYGVGLLIISVALYLTFSKGALLLGLPAGAIGMALFYLRRSQAGRRRWRPVLLATLGGLAVLALALIPLSQTERFRTVLDFNQGSTGFFRLKLWQASLAMLADHWPLGVGLDNFLYQYRTRYILPEAWQEPNLSHPHNLLLDFGTRLGIGGIALLVWLQVAFWRNAWRLYQKSPGPLILGLMGSMVVFLAHGLVDNSYFLVDLAFIFFLMVGIVQGLADTFAPKS